MQNNFSTHFDYFFTSDYYTRGKLTYYNTTTHVGTYTHVDLNCHLKFCSHKLSSNTSKASQVHAVNLNSSSVHTVCPFNLLLFAETDNNEAWLNTSYFFHSKCILAGEIPRLRTCSKASLWDQIMPWLFFRGCPQFNFY